MKLFQESGFRAEGNILPLDEFRLFIDWDKYEPDEKKLGKLIEKAEDFLENYELSTITLSQYRQYFTSGVLTHFSAPYQKRGNAMFYLGMAEAFERRGRFTEKLIDVIWAILEEASWVLPQHSGHTPMGAGTQAPPVVGDKYLHGMELGSVYRTASMAVVYHYCKDILDEVSPEISKRMLHEMKKRTIRPYLTATFGWTGEISGKCNNWCPWNVSNVLLTTALIEEDLTVREEVVKRAMAHLDIFINGYQPDGGCNEGATYWGGAAGSLFDCLETLYDMTGGKLSLYDNELIRRMGEFESTMNIAGTRFVNFADGSPTFIPPANLVTRYGDKCGSDVLYTFGKYMECHDDFNFCYPHPYRAMRALMTPSSKGDVEQPKAYISTYLPYLKVATFRDSEVANEGMFLAVKGGHNQESHNHNDVGNFIVYKCGNPVIIDVGVGAYTRDTFGKNRYTIWTMQSNYHNLAMFDGVGERQGRRYESTDEVYNEAEKTISMDISRAYPESLGVKKYKRELSLKDGVVRLTDEILTEEEREIDLVLMTHARPEVEGDVIRLAEGVRLTYPKECAYECEEFDPVGMDAVAKWGTPVLYRMHFKTVSRGGVFSFTIDGN